MIHIRELQLSDCERIFQWISNIELRKMTGTQGTPTRDTHSKWFENKVNDTNNIIRMIEYKGVPVGIVGTNTVDTYHKNANIYVYIGDSQYRNKGIATMALRLLTDILYTQYHCHKITATVRSYNEPSINLFKKSGFVCEGIQKEQVIYEGIYYDSILFGKIISKE